MQATEAATRPVVEARDISHHYTALRRRVDAIQRLRLQISPNEFVCIVGPSGCGKSTFLRIVAGLVRPSEGQILLNGAEVHGPGLDRGVVFQEPALFPWLRVRQNVEFGLRSAGWSRQRASERAMAVLRVVGLDKQADMYPYQLSGGMRHRVAVARGWALTDTSLLLMDEPFSAVDAITRARLQAHLVETWQSEPRAVLYVTHDIEEAAFLADRVIVFTPSPARIAHELTIDLPHPRDRDSEEFIRVRTQIARALDSAVAAHGSAQGAAQGAAHDTAHDAGSDLG